jgi:hypothetical protein
VAIKRGSQWCCQHFAGSTRPHRSRPAHTTTESSGNSGLYEVSSAHAIKAYGGSDRQIAACWPEDAPAPLEKGATKEGSLRGTICCEGDEPNLITATEALRDGVPPQPCPSHRGKHTLNCRLSSCFLFHRLLNQSEPFIQVNPNANKQATG